MLSANIFFKAAGGGNLHDDVTAIGDDFLPLWKEQSYLHCIVTTSDLLNKIFPLRVYRYVAECISCVVPKTGNTSIVVT